MTQCIQEIVLDLHQRQLIDWKLAGQNFAQLEKITERKVALKGATATLQFNAERIRSAAAKTDTKSLQARPCFLCAKNRPAEQESYLFQNKYEVLVNPFPIFKNHLTIADATHTDQRINERMGDMLQLAHALPDFVIFYNGPKCGASAPDHMHFQGAGKNIIPLQTQLSLGTLALETVITNDQITVSKTAESNLQAIILESKEAEHVVAYFQQIYNQAATLQPNELEPMMNILSWYDTEKAIYQVAVILRKAHRPWQFSAEGDAQILISPASVEMGGLFVLARQEDYQKITSDDLADILQQTLIDEADLLKILNHLS